MKCKHPNEVCMNMSFYHDDVYCDNNDGICSLDDEPWVLSNTDCIRDMSDESLAKFLMSDWFTKEICDCCEGEYDRCGDLKFCESKVLEWLLKKKH